MLRDIQQLIDYYCIAPGTHDWTKFISPDELDALIYASRLSYKAMNKSGISLCLPRPSQVLGDPLPYIGTLPSLMRSPPSTALKWKLDDDLEVNYIAHYKRYTGLSESDNM